MMDENFDLELHYQRVKFQTWLSKLFSSAMRTYTKTAPAFLGGILFFRITVAGVGAINCPCSTQSPYFSSILCV